LIYSTPSKKEAAELNGTPHKDTMSLANTGLKIMFLLSAIFFLFVFTAAPKTDCQACSIEYQGNTIDGHEAYEIFETECVSYRKPWQTDWELEEHIKSLNQTYTEKVPVYVDLDDINISEDGSLSWDPEDELTREEVDALTDE
jgi:hypothetical protein